MYSDFTMRENDGLLLLLFSVFESRRAKKGDSLQGVRTAAGRTWTGHWTGEEGDSDLRTVETPETEREFFSDSVLAPRTLSYRLSGA